MSEHHRTSAWAKAVRINKPRIAASLPARCIDCGRPVMPDQKWQVGHITPATVAKAMGWTVQQINAASNLGPTHTKSRGQKACNQIAGGKLGAQRTNAMRKKSRADDPDPSKRFPNF